MFIDVTLFSETPLNYTTALTESILCSVDGKPFYRSKKDGKFIVIVVRGVETCLLLGCTAL
jgi:hypothetical protein